MRQFWLMMLVALGLALSFVATVHGEVFGVNAEERIVKLPEDGGKWYLSVVGINDARYQEVLGWFTGVESLKSLKAQVHFCPVTSEMPVYAERYKPNVKASPTVRLQDSKGAVIFEAAGKDLPMSGEALYAEIAQATNGSKALLPLLPWRRQHQNLQPNVQPNVQPQPAPDSEPAPINNDGAPDMPEDSWLPTVIVLSVLALALGIGLGLAAESKAYHKS